MKTLEQEKAYLLDGYMKGLITPFIFMEKYKDLIDPKPASEDPFVDNLFEKRVENIIGDIIGVDARLNRIKLSECPHVDKLKGRRRIGPVSIKRYKDVMEEYGFKDKVS
jgi:hypothetical protein